MRVALPEATVVSHLTDVITSDIQSDGFRSTQCNFARNFCDGPTGDRLGPGFSEVAAQTRAAAPFTQRIATESWKE